MSINTYDEQKFWEEVDILFPDIVKAITSLAKKSYISITNLRNGVTWWSEKAMEYFGMQENYTIRGQEKSKRSIHPDDLEDFRRGFLERVAGKNMDEPWEYRVRDGSTYIRSQSSSSRSAVQQAIIDCSDYIKMVQKARKIKVFRAFAISKRADMV